MGKTVKYIKSPMNYIGGKYKLLGKLLQLFPKDIHTFVDLFAGGCNVCINVTADKIYANDINNYVIDIYRSFQDRGIQDILDYIDSKILEKGLTITDKDAYLRFRDEYNKADAKNSLDLYILLCYAFNNQIRFNNQHEFNSSFGKDRSSFNSSMRSNLITFHGAIKDIEFMNQNFKKFDYGILGDGDFLYADPPYLISVGSYNDGKRGFEGWTKEDDKALFNILDSLDSKGVKFALSNVLEHKGLKNEALIDWSSKYQVHKIDYTYKNSSYHIKDSHKDSVTKEVLITNY